MISASWPFLRAYSLSQQNLPKKNMTLSKQHPDIGARILAEFHSFHSVIDFVRHHHEHYDGSGYPDGLTGTQIPLEARILGLADAVEAMASSRPYHRPVTADEVKNEVMDCSGAHFDPEIVEAFLKVLNRLGDNIIVDSSNGVVVIESDSSDSTEASLPCLVGCSPQTCFQPSDSGCRACVDLATNWRQSGS